YLHSNNLIHRDIKARNILLNHKGQCKLADFGVSTQLQQTISKRNTVIGSPFWMAPEVFKQNTYDQKADIWSLGITVIEMAEGKPPLSELPPLRVGLFYVTLLKIPTNDPPTLYDKEKWSDALHDFLRRCLVLNSSERWSAKELLQHKFIKSAGKRTVTAALVASAMPLIEQFHGQKKPAKSTPVNPSNGHRTKPAKIVRTEAKSVNATPVPGNHGDKRSIATSGTDDWSTIVRHDPALSQLKNAIEKDDPNLLNSSATTTPITIPTTATPTIATHKKTLSQTQTPTQIPTQIQNIYPSRKPNFDTSNPHFKSSPYYLTDGESLNSWQLFDINKNDNIRSKDWIVRSVLEPSLLDELNIENYLPENPTQQQLETLKQKLISAHKRDQEILEQHYISVRRQIRERIQNVNSNRTRAHKMSMDSNGTSPKVIQSNIKSGQVSTKASRSKSNATDTTTNQIEKTKNVKSDNQNFEEKFRKLSLTLLEFIWQTYNFTFYEIKTYLCDHMKNNQQIILGMLKFKLKNLFFFWKCKKLKFFEEIALLC
ncbi:hypothetical protein RFI_17281, partial [Reticulomyxa filosa]